MTERNHGDNIIEVIQPVLVKRTALSKKHADPTFYAEFWIPEDRNRSISVYNDKISFFFPYKESPETLLSSTVPGPDFPMPSRFSFDHWLPTIFGTLFYHSASEAEVATIVHKLFLALLQEDVRYTLHSRFSSHTMVTRT